jgi:nitroreductase
VSEGFISYRPPRLSEQEMLRRARDLFEQLDTRRSVRDFSAEPVPRALIEWAIRAAGTAPSGAHQQPWTFVVVGDPTTKSAIREAAEEEERAFYDGRAPEAWRSALARLGTDWRKPYLEVVPWIVVCFEQTSGVAADGSAIKHYYVKESVGIACGLFIAALHHIGLSTLTHTPSPMGFLRQLLGRPSNERPTILFPIGYPAEDAKVPNLQRKDLGGVSEFFE